VNINRSARIFKISVFLLASIQFEYDFLIYGPLPLSFLFACPLRGTFLIAVPPKCTYCKDLQNIRYAKEIAAPFDFVTHLNCPLSFISSKRVNAHAALFERLKQFGVHQPIAHTFHYQKCVVSDYRLHMPFNPRPVPESGAPR
jgi:hypothetical protein